VVEDLQSNDAAMRQSASVIWLMSLVLPFSTVLASRQRNGKILHTSSISNFEASTGVVVKSTKSRFPRMSLLFLITVFAPVLLSIIYFGWMASDVFISESRFVVRNPQRQPAPGLGALLQGAGFTRSQDDTYSVYDFMLSRDALRELDTKLALNKTFGSKSIDVFSRFDPLSVDRSFESLYLYYLNHVDIHVDTASSISSLKISAFSADDAYRMNVALLDMAERLVNQLNERGRQDLIRFASSEVDSAAQRAKAAAYSLSTYRTGQGLFDPERQSALQLQHIAKLQDELIASKMQLAHLRTYTPQNPQLASVQTRVDTLQSEIAAVMGKVAGPGASLASKAAEFERLLLEQTVAGKQLAGALASLEQARNDSQRKQLYLERIVQPNKPDIAIQPRRVRAILATFILGLLAWGILSVLIAGLREHRG
jgi:capsular polysaccharide transport system permease protein